MNSLSTDSKIEAREVPESERLSVLPRHFGRDMMRVEQAVYHAMGELAVNYTGGYWKYFELSNGGFFMAPSGADAFDIQVDGNGYAGRMSADAAGITACLFALSQLSFRIQSERIASHFHWLREFAIEHPEGAAILAAID